MSDSAIDILRRDREALLAREERLNQLIEEGNRTRKARAAIEKALEQLGSPARRELNPASAAKTQRAAAAAPTGTLPDAIVEACRTSLDPLSHDEIAEKIGREPGAYIAMCATKLVTAGKLVKVGTKYGVPQVLDTFNN